jgi:hypothetical protein
LAVINFGGKTILNPSEANSFVAAPGASRTCRGVLLLCRYSVTADLGVHTSKMDDGDGTDTTALGRSAARTAGVRRMHEHASALLPR